MYIISAKQIKKYSWENRGWVNVPENEYKTAYISNKTYDPCWLYISTNLSDAVLFDTIESAQKCINSEDFNAAIIESERIHIIDKSTLCIQEIKFETVQTINLK